MITGKVALEIGVVHSLQFDQKDVEIARAPQEVAIKVGKLLGFCGGC
jgi:translation initiation factor IF-2